MMEEERIKYFIKVTLKELVVKPISKKLDLLIEKTDKILNKFKKTANFYNCNLNIVKNFQKEVLRFRKRVHYYSTNKLTFIFYNNEGRAKEWSIRQELIY